MADQELMNLIYDILAQNKVEIFERDIVTRLIDHVDLDDNTINFVTEDGSHFALKLIKTFKTVGFE